MLAFKGIENIAATIKLDDNRPLELGDVFTNPIFRNIVLSLLATLGLYVIASLIFVSPFCYDAISRSRTEHVVDQFEPWHMITSFIQYLLMAPSYIAVLNVYAVRIPPSSPDVLCWFGLTYDPILVCQRARRVMGYQGR